MFSGLDTETTKRTKGHRSVRVLLQCEEDRERRRRRRITMEKSIEYVHVTEKRNKEDMNSKLCNDLLNSSSLYFPVTVQRIERQRRKVPWTKQRHKETSFESKLSLFCIIGFEILLDLVLFCVKSL